MANLNRVLLIGRLTADPELRHTTSDIPVASFTVAINRRARSGEQPKADFIDVVAWRQLAEFVTRFFRKGSPIFVGGSLQLRTWKDNQGNNRRTYEVIADDLQFVESRRESQAAGGGDNAFSNAPVSEFEEIGPDEELPF